MYCKKCGHPIEEGSGFCNGCGAPLKPENKTILIEEESNGANNETESLVGHYAPGNAGPAVQRGIFEQPANLNGLPQMKLKQKMKRSKLHLIIIVALVLVIGAAAAALFGVSALEIKKYDELIDTGNKYLEELKYEEAVETFIEAIDIKPKREEAYVGAATGYIGLDEPENARDILEKGLENVKEPGDKFKDLCDELGVEYGKKSETSPTGASETTTDVATSTTESILSETEVSTAESLTTKAPTTKVTTTIPSTTKANVDETVTIEKAFKYLTENVPEVKEFLNGTERICRLENEPDPSADDYYDREYYAIYVGYDHENNTERWNTFYVKKDLSDIRVLDMSSGEVISLIEWRQNGTY